jgi:hypothetical protein
MRGPAVHTDDIHVLIVPPGLPDAGFRWPVFARDVLIVDLDLGNEAAERTRAFARRLMVRWKARSVQAAGDFDPFHLGAPVAQSA